MRLRAAAAAAVAAYLRGICITVLACVLVDRVGTPLAVEHTSREQERSGEVVSGVPAAAIAGSALQPSQLAMAPAEARRQRGPALNSCHN